MSVKITLQILGSIGATGTVTTGLVFGLPKLKTAFQSVVSDVAPVKSLDEITNVVIDNESKDEISVSETVNQSIDPIADKEEASKNAPETPTKTTTPPLKVVDQPQQPTLNIKPRTHIEKIESYKWTDKQVELDWAAVTSEKGEEKSILYFLAEVNDYPENNVKLLVSEFLLTTQGKTIMKIKCNGDQSFYCLPMYEFSDNPQNLDDLDLSKLVKIYNIGWSREDPDPLIIWPKYIVFAIDQEKTKTLMTNDLHVFDEGYSKLNEWKKIYESNNNSFPISSGDESDNEKNTLSLKISYEKSEEIWNPKLKIINFLTPSFELKDEDEEEEGDDDMEINSETQQAQD